MVENSKLKELVKEARLTGIEMFSTALFQVTTEKIDTHEVTPDDVEFMNDVIKEAEERARKKAEEVM